MPLQPETDLPHLKLESDFQEHEKWSIPKGGFLLKAFFLLLRFSPKRLPRKGWLPCEIWEALNDTLLCSCSQDIALSNLKTPLVWSTFAGRSQLGLTTGWIQSQHEKQAQKRAGCVQLWQGGSPQTDIQEFQCLAEPFSWSHSPACCTVPVETLGDFRTGTGHTNGTKMILKCWNKRHFGTKLAEPQSPQCLCKIERKNP